MSSECLGDEVALQPAATCSQDPSRVQDDALRAPDRFGAHLLARHTLRVRASNSNIFVLGHIRPELHCGRWSTVYCRGGSRESPPFHNELGVNIRCIVRRRARNSGRRLQACLCLLGSALRLKSFYSVCHESRMQGIRRWICA